MKCPRGHGEMAVEHLYDLQSGYPFHVLAWRCVQCGIILDKTILENRTLSHTSGAKKRRVLHVKAA